MTACGHCGGWQLARKRPPALPRSTFGSPEDIIERGTDTLAAQTERLGVAIARATHGLSSAKAIQAAIRKTGKAWNRDRLAFPLERELAHGAWLGALDADFEARTNRPVKVESFAALHAPILLAPYDKSTDPAFATRPVTDARKQFERREAVTRDVYDAMADAARRRSVTVAGAATNEVVRTVQRELVRQVSEGAELRDFAKRVVPRLEAAGWTPQNASHIENVLRTNVGSAYNAGRARQMMQPTVLRFRPYWQIVTVNDGPPRQRATHQAVHLVVLAADDPFWLTAYPPFGFQCRCRVRSLSRREGEPLLRSGSSIHDLPDRGFTSGLSQLDVPPPQMPPANDTMPPPANDTVPPPVKPRRSMQERLDVIGSPTLELAGEVPEKLQRASLRGIEAALGEGGASSDSLPRLPRVQITSEIQHEKYAHNATDPSINALPEGTGGVYLGPAGGLRIGAAPQTIANWGEFRIEDYDPTGDPELGKPRFPLAMTDIAPSKAVAVEMVACHETAHHIHMGPLDYDRRHFWMDRPDGTDEADLAIHREFVRKDRQDVSYYGKTDRFEFFAESLTAYRYTPEWLERYQPRTVALVRKVLALRGLK